jgi:hypothetical protein
MNATIRHPDNGRQRGLNNLSFRNLPFRNLIEAIPPPLS